MKIEYQKNIGYGYSYSFFAFLGITSLWVIYLQQRGLSLVEIGLCESIFHVASFLFEVPSGLLADRFSYKSVLLSSRLMAIMSAILMLVSHNFWMFALSFVISAFSYNLQSGTLEALLYDSLKLEQTSGNYPRVISKVNMIIEFTDTFGVVLAGLFVHWHFALVYVIDILASCAALTSVLLLKEPIKLTGIAENDPTNQPQPEKTSEKKLTLKKLIMITWQSLKKQPLLRNLMFFQALFDGFCTTYYFYFQTLLDSQNFSGWQISLLLVISAGLDILAMQEAPKLQSKVSKTKLIIVLSSCLIGMLLLGWLDKIGILLFVFLFSNALSSLSEPIFSSYYNDLIDSKSRATLLSVANLLFSLIMVGIFPLTGWLIEKLDFAAAFGIFGVILLLALGIILRYLVHRNSLFQICRFCGI